MPSTTRKISSGRKIDKVAYCPKCKHSQHVFTLWAKYVNMGDKYRHKQRNGGNTTNTPDGTIWTPSDPFCVVDAIWMLAVEAKRHTHSAIVAFG